jgi:double-strand break repair protein MRE11
MNRQSKGAAQRKTKAANNCGDEEEEEEVVEEEDVIMEDDVEPEPPTKTAARSTRSRGSAARPRQTTLNFSQTQKPKTLQKPVEISDDEISEDDAFESMPATRTRRR